MKMRGKTHMVGGFAAGAIAGVVLNLSFSEAAFLSAVGCIGGLVPDIDHANSIITQKTGLIGWLASRLFRHRGILHTPAVYLVSSLVLSFFLTGPYERLFIMGLLIGELSHLVLDSLNTIGIMWLWPLSRKRFRVLAVRTGGAIDKAICTVCSICSAAVLIFFLV